MKSESEIKKEIKKFLDKAGFFNHHIKQAKWSYKGTPDRFAFRRGHCFLIEVKKKNGKLSKEQIEYGADITPHCGKFLHYVVVSDVEDLIDYVKNLGWVA